MVIRLSESVGNLIAENQSLKEQLKKEKEKSLGY